MAMPQLTYNLNMDLAFEGAGFDGSQDSYCRSASNNAAASFFGRACLAVAGDGQQFVQPTGTAGVFIGILKHSHAIEPGQVTAGGAGLPVNHPGAVMRRGRIWVIAENEIDDLTKAVYYRHANSGALPEALGRFRDDDDGASGDVTIIAGAKWGKVNTAVGMLTFIELNLP
jgi:hypothetical protein